MQIKKAIKDSPHKGNIESVKIKRCSRVKSDFIGNKEKVLENNSRTITSYEVDIDEDFKNHNGLKDKKC